MRARAIIPVAAHVRYAYGMKDVCVLYACDVKGRKEKTMDFTHTNTKAKFCTYFICVCVFYIGRCIASRVASDRILH